MAMRINTRSITAGEDILPQVLLQQQLCDENWIQKIRADAQSCQQTLFQYIMQYHIVDPEKLCDASAQFFNLKKSILQNKNKVIVPDYFPFELIQTYFLLPINKDKERSN